MVRAAEQDLGVRLPSSYVEMLYVRNGGSLLRSCFPTSYRTSWAPDHFSVKALLGIGGKWGIDSSSGLGGSAYLIEEWGYPKIGVVVGLTPSGGHDTVMLDYSNCGPSGEPAIAYVDEDRVPRRVAGSFSAFVEGLVTPEQFPQADE